MIWRVTQYYVMDNIIGVSVIPSKEHANETNRDISGGYTRFGAGNLSRDSQKLPGAALPAPGGAGGGQGQGAWMAGPDAVRKKEPRGRGNGSKGNDGRVRAGWPVTFSFQGVRGHFATWGVLTMSFCPTPCRGLKSRCKFARDCSRAGRGGACGPPGGVILRPGMGGGGSVLSQRT